MKKLTLLLALLITISIWAQVPVKNLSTSVLWQDSLTATDTAQVINLNTNYRYLYLVLSNDSTNTDSVRIESGTINYIIGSISTGKSYVPHDTVWAYTTFDSLGTTLNSSLVHSPTGTIEYLIDNYGIQLLRITLFNSKPSVVKYNLRAIKYNVY